MGPVAPLGGRRALLQRWSSVVALLAARLLVAAAARSFFPPDVTICSAKDPKINECFLSSANKMFPHLADGLRDIDAVPIDPLVVPKLELKKGNHVIPSLEYNMTDAVHRGWKNAYLTRAKVDLEALEFEMTIFLPKLHMHSLYEVGIPLTGHGDLNFNFANTTYDLYVRGRLEERGGRHFFAMSSYRQRSHIGYLHFDVRNLFDNAVASNITNNLLKWSMRPILDVSTPIVDELAGPVHAELVERIFKKVPFDAMFTDLDLSSKHPMR